MNLATMALVTLVVFAEKALAWERAAVYGTAAVLMLYGAAVSRRRNCCRPTGWPLPG